MELGRPTCIPVKDIEMGFEKIVKVAHARGGKVAFYISLCRIFPCKPVPIIFLQFVNDMMPFHS